MSLRAFTTQHHPPSGKVGNAALKAASPGRAARPVHSNRDGVTLVAVLVTLGLITALLLGAFQSSLKQRRQLDRELQMEQTRWLVRAAIAHAEVIAGSKEGLAAAPIILKPKLSGGLQSKIRIEFGQSENKNTVTAKAWIGDEDRPEHSTQIELYRILDTLPENSSRD